MRDFANGAPRGQQKISLAPFSNIYYNDIYSGAKPDARILQKGYAAALRARIGKYNEL